MSVAMFHSSAVPIALPLSVMIGLGFYVFFHDSCDMDIASSMALAKIACGISNLSIGIPKNVILGDILSLIFVRPISLIVAIYALVWLIQ